MRQGPVPPRNRSRAAHPDPRKDLFLDVRILNERLVRPYCVQTLFVRHRYPYGGFASEPTCGL